ncbi:MAG: hypothetical protein AAGE52_42220, partial [Myxococcota bacterium]
MGRWALLALLWSAAANAQDALSIAESAFAESNLDAASAALRDALASGALDSRSLARVYVLEGVIAVADGQQEVASRAFERALILAPETETPAELGPDEAAAFEDLRRRAEESPLTLELDHEPVLPGAPVVVQATVRHRSDELVARLQAAVLDGEEVAWSGTSLDGAFAIPETQRRGDSLRVRVRAVDPRGNTVREETLSVALPQVEANPEPNVLVTPPAPEEEATPLRHKWWLWTIVGVVVGAGAAGVGIWA